MVNYCTPADIRLYQNITSTSDDPLFEMFIETASRDIETHCGRRFYSDDEIRKYNPLKDAENNLLYLDYDLQSVEEITNGDGEVIPAEDYVLLPTNFSPKWGIMLKTSASTTWTYETDPEESIQVEGAWGYVDGSVPPAQIKHACIRLAFWYYKQKDAPFEVTGLPDGDQVIVPVAMPKDVERILEPFKRRLIMGVGGQP